MITVKKSVEKTLDETFKIMHNALCLENVLSIDELINCYWTDLPLSKKFYHYDNLHEFIDALEHKSIDDNSPFADFFELDDDDIDMLIRRAQRQIAEVRIQANQNLEEGKSDNHLIFNRMDELEEFFNWLDEKRKTLEKEGKETKGSEEAEVEGPSKHKSQDDDIDDFQQIIMKYSPRDDMTSFYQISFFKKYMYLYLNQPYENSKFSNYVWERSVRDVSANDRYLQPLYSMIVDIIKDEGIRSVFAFCRVYRSKIQYNIHSIVRENDFSGEKLELLRLYVQLLSGLITIESNNRNVQNCYDEALAYLNFYISETFLGKSGSISAMGISFAKKGLGISNQYNKQEAFNTLGLLAIETGGQLQLAYDTYYSWIKCEMVGELSSISTKTTVFDVNESEKTRRGVFHSRRLATMYGNLADVSRTIGDTYETGGKESCERRQQFYIIARRAIEAAIKHVPVRLHYRYAMNYRRVYGDILTEQSPALRDYPLALEQYSKYLEYAKKAHDSEAMITAINRYNQTIIKALTSSFLQVDCGPCKEESFIDWENLEITTKYWEDLKDAKRKYDSIPWNKGAQISNRERIKKEKILSLLEFENKYRGGKYTLDISLLLLLIGQVANNIQEQLRRLEYSYIDYFTREEENDIHVTGKRSDVKTIAYYTTLKNASYLFDELVQENPETAPRVDKDTNDGRNCLTVVHAKYMNDPYEGLPLLESLSSGCTPDYLFHDKPIKFREDLYNESYIFLKSFTEKVDKLFMWNRYASDYDEDGKNSNGCCIQFDPETFNQIILGQSKDKSITRNEDDYYLYRMVYLTSDGNINKDQNPGITDETIELFSKLKILFMLLNAQLKKISSTKNAEHIREDVQVLLRRSLKTIIFLFKSDDYAEEVESRLIFERRHDQSNSIRLVSKNPFKIAINPYKQIYINKIVFGPNVRNEEEWIPFFQYELNKLWTKYSTITGDESEPPYKRYTITKSEIHYHT